MNKSMKVLVCGGAGYIGSHMVKMLVEHGHKPVTLDNLSTGHRKAVKAGEFIQTDLLDAVALEVAFGRIGFDAVIHFAARSLVGESVVSPHLYYQNNVVGTLNLLEVLRKHGPDRIVFSSSCSVYGLHGKDGLTEAAPLAPANPYARSKLIVEQALADYASAYGVNSVALRYFNAAGCDPSGSIGESHNPETHLIPNVLESAKDASKKLRVFGLDYPTRDGSCIRDYVHVNDLCRAHLSALEYLDHNHGAHVFNLGIDKGFSVLEVIEAVKEVTGAKISYKVAEPRPGDVATLVADSSKARQELDWNPRYTELPKIIETAWRWKRDPQY